MSTNEKKEIGWHLAPAIRIAACWRFFSGERSEDRNLPQTEADTAQQQQQQTAEWAHVRLYWW